MANKKESKIKTKVAKMNSQHNVQTSKWSPIHLSRSYVNIIRCTSKKTWRMRCNDYKAERKGKCNEIIHVWNINLHVKKLFRIWILWLYHTHIIDIEFEYVYILFSWNRQCVPLLLRKRTWQQRRPQSAQNMSGSKEKHEFMEYIKNYFILK